jgi:hypothetical protein
MPDSCMKRELLSPSSVKARARACLKASTACSGLSTQRGQPPLLKPAAFTHLPELFLEGVACGKCQQRKKQRHASCVAHAESSGWRSEDVHQPRHRRCSDPCLSLLLQAELGLEA